MIDSQSQAILDCSYFSKDSQSEMPVTLYYVKEKLFVGKDFILLVL